MASLSLFEAVYIVYFLLHIPVTLFVDLQSILPASLFPPFAKDLVRWHVKTNGDWLVGSNPLWFQAVIAGELVFQLPCFVLLVYGLLKRKRWTRPLGIIYGTHAATTFVPILGEILFGRPLTTMNIKLALIYLPYLIAPAILALRMALWAYPSQTSIWKTAKDTASSMASKSKLSRPPSLLRRPFDLVFVLYFFIHVPITVLFDAQSIVPRDMFPPWATDAIDWHVKVNSDHLVQHNPTWFVALVVCECLVHLPAFFVLTYGLMTQGSWVRVPALVYGVHVVTTMIPILAEFLVSGGAPNIQATLVYSPWLLLPLALAVRMAIRPYPNTLQAKLQSKEL